MIRSLKYSNKDYLVVNTTLELQKENNSVKAPVDIRVDISKLSEADRVEVFKKVDTAFNHRLLMKDTESSFPRKPWWKKLFS